MPPTLVLPRETDEYVGPLLTLEWDGTPTTDVEIGMTEVGTRPDTAFNAYPGAKVPTTPGAYLIQARKSGLVRDIGILVIT